MSNIIEWINREEENNLPEFSSFQEAKAYFIERYGTERFVVTSAEEIEDGLCYFCYLITNPAVYWEGQHIMTEQGHLSDHGEYINSCQPIQIMEDGSIHIVH